MTEPPAQADTEAQRSTSAHRSLRRRVFPGFLALGWMVYLLLGAGKTFFLTRPIVADAAYFEAAMREMLLIVAVGLTLLWPLVRLSQRHPRPVPLLLLDVFVILALSQVVIWPLIGKTHWPVHMLFQLDALFAGWTLLAAGLVALGVCFHSVWGRVAAMILCAVSVFIGPALLASHALPHAPPWLTYASPLAATWRLHSASAAWPGYVLELAGAVGCAGLLLLALGAVARSRWPLGA